MDKATLLLITSKHAFDSLCVSGALIASESLTTAPTEMGSIWSGIWDEVYFAYNRRASKVKADKEGLVVANSTKVDENTEIHPGAMGEEVRYASETSAALIPVGIATDTYYDYELRNYVNDINQEYVQVLSAYDETGTTREVYTYGNERLTFSDGQDTFTYAYTGMRSVSALTDTNGRVVSNYTYAAWGIYEQAAKNLAGTSAAYSDSTRNSISKDGNYAATNATAGSLSMVYISDATSNPYSFNAEYTDESTGFIYLRARYYDAVTGIFLTQDSYAGNLLDARSQNRYTYAEDDPVNYIDPSGHRAVATMMTDSGGKMAAKKVKNNSAVSAQALKQEQLSIRNKNRNKTKTTVSAGGVSEIIKNISNTDGRKEGNNVKNARTKAELKRIIELCNKMARANGGMVTKGGVVASGLSYAAELEELWFQVSSYAPELGPFEWLVFLAIIAGAIGLGAKHIYQYFTQNNSNSLGYNTQVTQTQVTFNDTDSSKPADDSQTDNTSEKEIPEKELGELPDNVQDSFNKYNEAGWTGNVSGQTPGTKAGGKYENDNGELPETDDDGNSIEYKEWDVNNKQGSTRDSERFVTGTDGSVYYTSDHYNSFVKIILP